MSIEAAARQAREALNWYGDEAVSCAKYSGSAKHNAAEALLASVSVLALDAGNRAAAAIAALDAALSQPQAASEREEFEAWCRQRWAGDRGALDIATEGRYVGEYRLGNVQGMWAAWQARAALSQAAPAEPVTAEWQRGYNAGYESGGRDADLEHGLATPPAPEAPLDDPRLQGLFSDAISGALAFGAQNTNPPPAGHWLERFWQMGRAEQTK
jgi:hypothetical protein